MATHNLDVLKKYPKNRVIALEKGKLITDKNEKATQKSAPADFQQAAGFTIVAQDQTKEDKQKEKKEGGKSN